MTRKETTKLLSDLLIKEYLTGFGKYYAHEVSFDYGEVKGKPIRIDFLQYTPKNQLSISGLENGYFTAYEVKSCREDILSGHGMNFNVAEKNYLVMTLDTYKRCKDLFDDYTIPYYVGVIAAIPVKSGTWDKLQRNEEKSEKWSLQVVKPCRKQNRQRSMIELLFCMLRSGK